MKLISYHDLSISYPRSLSKPEPELVVKPFEIKDVSIVAYVSCAYLYGTNFVLLASSENKSSQHSIGRLFVTKIKYHASFSDVSNCIDPIPNYICSSLQSTSVKNSFIGLEVFQSLPVPFTAL